MSTTDRINYEANKDPETLEREIDEQRAEISDTLAALEQRFSPGELFDKALGYARGNGGEFMHNLADTVRANPVPTVLTAVGLAWLMAGQNRRPASYYGDSYSSHTGSGIADKARQLKANVSDRLHSAGQHLNDGSHRLGDTAHRVGDSGRHLGQSMSDSLHHGADTARYQAARARQGFDTMLREQPLALGAIGIAVGALLGGLMPPTRREDELMGATADRLKARAGELAREGAAQARDKGHELTDKMTQQHRSSSDRPQSRTDQTGLTSQQSLADAERLAGDTTTAAGTTGQRPAYGARSRDTDDLDRLSQPNGQSARSGTTPTGTPPGTPL